MIKGLVAACGAALEHSAETGLPVTCDGFDPLRAELARLETLMGDYLRV